MVLYDDVGFMWGFMMMWGLKINVLGCRVDILETNGAFTSPETIWLNRDGNNQPGPFCFTPTEARWLIRDGDRGEGDEIVKARPRITAEKTRRDRGPPPEQWKCLGGVPSPLPSDYALRNCCFNCRAWAESQGQCPLHCC